MLTRCQRKMERKILHLTLRDKINSDIIRSKTKIQDAVSQAEKLKWSWAGHVTRMKQERWAYATTVWCPRIGWRAQGRPRKKWTDGIKQKAGNTWQRVAQDRQSWKKLGFT